MDPSSATPEPATAPCLACGAPNPLPATECWLCGAANWRSPESVKPGRPSPRFGLAAILLWIAVIAVFFAAIREAPGLGIFMSIAAVPALAYTVIRTQRSRNEGQPTTPLGQIGVFVVSTGAVMASLLALSVVIGVSLLVAFLAVCACSSSGAGS